MINNMSWSGKFVIEIKDKKTGTTKTEVINNKVMDAVLNKLVQTLQGIEPNVQIKYLALGTSSAAVTTSDTRLGTEIFRTPVSGQESTALGEVTTDFVVLDTEAVGSIREVGIFGGSTATGAANSGVLISRILWSREKTDSEEINIKRIDRIGRGNILAYTQTNWINGSTPLNATNLNKMESGIYDAAAKADTYTGSDVISKLAAEDAANFKVGSLLNVESSNVRIGKNVVAIEDGLAGSVVIGNYAGDGLTPMGNSFSNVIIGVDAVSSPTQIQKSVIIGGNTNPAGNGEENEIVIGNKATGHGSNTATIGDSKVIELYLGNNKIPQIVAVPSTATSSGQAGQIAYDSNFFYACVATNTWVRAALSSW